MIEETKKPRALVIFYNQVCRNHGNHPKCLGRFKRYASQAEDLCPNCVHLSRTKK